MKRILSTITAIAAAISLTVSCADLGEIEKKIDELDSRVTALETLTSNLNKNIEALQELSGATFIKNVDDETEGKYIIELSNGKKIEIVNGTEGVGIAPLLRINSENKWEVNYTGDASNEDAWQLIGEGIPATGENGKSPIFGVDDEGYWTVKYSENDTPERVLDNNNQPVKATTESEGDSFFENVEYDEANNVFKVTLSGGSKELSLPVIGDISFIIKDNGNTITDIVTFQNGETRIFNVEATGIQTVSIITIPENWNATLEMNDVQSSGTLSVTAPVVTRVNNVVADTRTDISILVVSSKGLSFIAKLKVQLDGSIIYTPVASITYDESTATESTLTFNVNMQHSDAYYYILKEHEGDTAPAEPTAEELRNNGTRVTEAGALVIDTGLTKNTKYTLFVLPVNGETDGEIKSQEAKTIYGEITDYYEAYMAGVNIEIAGEIYNNTTHPNAVLIEANNTDVELTSYNDENLISKGGIYFLATTGEHKFTSKKATVEKDIILIGKNVSQKTIIQPTDIISMKSGIIAFKNISVDITGRNGYIFNMTTSANLPQKAFEKFHFDGCEINGKETGGGNSFAYYNDGRGIKSIRFMNCDIITPTGQNDYKLFNVTKNDYMHEFEDYRFENNLVYSNNGSTLQLFNYNGAAQTSTDCTSHIKLTNNTFYNIGSANSLFRYYNIVSIEIKDNIFICGKSTAKFSVINLFGSKADILFNIGNNIGQCSIDKITYCAGNYTNKPSPNTIDNTNNILIEENINTGTFTPAPDYASYGAQR